MRCTAVVALLALDARCCALRVLVGTGGAPRACTPASPPTELAEHEEKAGVDYFKPRYKPRLDEETAGVDDFKPFLPHLRKL